MIRSRRSFGWTVASVLIVTFVLVGMQRWAYATTLRDRLDSNGIFRTTTPPPSHNHEEVVQDHKNSSAVESGPEKSTSEIAAPRPNRKGIHHDPASNCEWLPDTSNILLVMKTGASESYNKVPTQLMTTLRCLADFYIFSDMKQTIVGVDILDSLDTVLESAKEGNKDFDLYRNQMKCPVDQELCNKGGDSSSAGWNLDKYKNIHMAEKTYRMKPNYDWYIFVDADSYVLWPNMVRWLSTFKPTDKRYLGSAAMIGDHPFGHGGSGYIVSQATMKEFIGDHPGIANQYDEQIKDNCCGDFVFAKALKEVTGVGVENSWPTINGEKPYTLPFGPTHWCHAVVTMHHLAAEETSMFWEWEREFYRNQTAEGTSRPLLLKDIFHQFLAPKLVEKREDWDNNSDNVFYLNATAKEYEKWQVDRAKKGNLSPVEQDAHKSFDNCRAMCEEVEECMQFRFQDGICAYSKAMLLGQPKHEKDESKRWTSGWPLKKIHAWIEKQGECKKPIWPNV